MNLYKNVAKKAEAINLSINSLESKAGLSTGSIYKWNAVSPSVKNLAKVADVLGCSIDELIADAAEQE